MEISPEIKQSIISRQISCFPLQQEQLERLDERNERENWVVKGKERMGRKKIKGKEKTSTLGITNADRMVQAKVD